MGCNAALQLTTSLPGQPQKRVSSSATRLMGMGSLLSGLQRALQLGLFPAYFTERISASTSTTRTVQSRYTLVM